MRSHSVKGGNPRENLTSMKDSGTESSANCIHCGSTATLHAVQFCIAVVIT